MFVLVCLMHKMNHLFIAMEKSNQAINNCLVELVGESEEWNRLVKVCHHPCYISNDITSPLSPPLLSPPTYITNR
jgi:hypothetical protein